jgi:metal-dependent amidase/aminoacylase/carboxypeptidase family protein
MRAAGESSGCTAELEWQGDHALFDHAEYEQASRTYADVSRPFLSWDRSILAEIFLCHACSCQEMLRTETAGQVLSNPTLAETFRANWDAQGTELRFRSAQEDRALAMAGGGSSDMGNVSHVLPAIHPSFAIDTQYGNHHPGFTEFSGRPEAMAVAKVAGKAMAGTALDLLFTPALVAEARQQFEEMKASSVVWEPHYVGANEQ